MCEVIVVEKRDSVAAPATLNPSALLKTDVEERKFSGYVVLGDAHDSGASGTSSSSVSLSSTEARPRGPSGHYVTVGGDELRPEMSGYVSVATVSEPRSFSFSRELREVNNVDPGYVTAAVLSFVPSPSSSPPEAEVIPMAHTLPLSNTSYMPGYVTTC